MVRLLNRPLDFARRIKRIPRVRAQRRTLDALSPPQERRIIIGASRTGYPGWISTDREVLDLLDENTWSRYFESDSVDAILAEHVWEHLELAQAVTAANTCMRFLKPGGHLRLAVPDGLHPDPTYVEAARPGGHGSGAYDHRVLYTHASLRALFQQVGFHVELLEYFDESGQFHCCDWDPDEGMIKRSRRFDARNRVKELAYTSIVMDAVKPARAANVSARA